MAKQQYKYKSANGTQFVPIEIPKTDYRLSLILKIEQKLMVIRFVTQFISYFTGNTRPVHIPGCVVFNVTLNACRGFCESFAIPSPSLTLRVNPKHEITSRAECCSMKETHDVSTCVLRKYAHEYTEF